MFCLGLLLLIDLLLIQYIHLQLRDFILHAPLPGLNFLYFVLLFHSPQHRLLSQYPHLFLQVVARCLYGPY